MRIVHLTNAGGYGRTQSGGAERAVAELASELSESHGWDEHIVAPAEFFVDRPIAASVTQHEIDLDAFSTGQMFRGGELAALIRDLAPDVAVGHLLRGTLVGLTAAKGEAKCVSILHNSLSDYAHQPGHRPIKHAFNRFAFRAVSRRAIDLHVAISETNRRDLIEHEHVSAEKIVTIHNWVSSAFTPLAAERRSVWRASHGLTERDRVVLIAGRLERQKNQELVIGLLPELKDHALVLAGEGELFTAYAELAARLGVDDRLHQIGFEQDIAGAMAAADVVAVPSRFEGFGRSVIEALAVGTPVVATNLDAISEVLRDAPSNSYSLCRLDDKGAWTAALDELSSTSLRGSTLGQEVEAFVGQNYSLKGAAAAYDRAFRELVAADPPE